MVSLSNTSPLLSIITVSFNGLNDTLELLHSLANSHCDSMEVIVVDNASEINHQAEINQRFPEVKVIRSETNLGFAGGNNLGIQVAKGKLIMLLNNDTLVQPDFAAGISKAFSARPKTGIVASKIQFTHSPGIVQFAGSTPINPYTITSFAIGYGERDEGQYDVPVQSPIAHGAAMTVSREAIERAGLMTEDYFLYYEEIDWCYRIKQAGYEIWFEPSSLIYHKESMSTGKSSPLKEYYKTRNRILFARKNLSGMQRIVCLAYLFLVANPIHLFKKTLQGNIKLAKAQLKGLLWHLSPSKFNFN